MIDLTDITPIADSTIRLCEGNHIVITFTQFAPSEIVQDLCALRDKGISVCGDLHHDRGENGDFFIYVRNYNPVQIAERIACYIESKGLSVSRLAVDPKAHHKTPVLPVQSFIFLA